MTPQDKIRELEEFEHRQSEIKRTAARVSSLALLGAALILVAMIAGAWWQLRSLRAETARERQKQSDLKAENDQLAKRNTALKAQNELSANYIRRRDPVIDPVVGTPQPAAAPQSLPARIYIQILDDTDRPFAAQMRDKLAAAGFLVVGIEWVKGNTTLNATEVRYYKQADADTAAKIVGLLEASGIKFVRSLYLKRYETSTTVRARHFEVWFPARPTERQKPARSA